MAEDKNRDTAIRAKAKIRDYWRTKTNEFFPPNVTINMNTYELKSDMVDGYPARRK